MAASVVDATDGVEVPNLAPGITPFMVTVTVATTSIDDAGDDILLYKFPANAYLLSSSIAAQWSDLDTGTSLQVDIGIGDSDGVIDTLLINDSAAGQTGVGDFVDAAADAPPFIDVGGKYLIQTVATAAQTGAAGTVAVGGIYAGNLVPLTSS